MTYDEAEKLIVKYDWFNDLGVTESEGTVSYPIKHKIIAPKDRLWDIFHKVVDNGLKNKDALIDLDLITENLRVFAIAQNKYGNYVWEDMYNFLLDSSQL